MKEIRWQQRFENYEKAFLLLNSPFEAKELADFSDLEQEGLVQRFEYTFELAWKTLKDYLVYEGIKLEKTTPRETIKQAFAANIIQDGQIWINMLEHRNLMSHTYDKIEFEKAMQAIKGSYLDSLRHLYMFFKKIN